jgi:predicted DNA-binding transcriptional regulator AlpA
MTKIDGLLTEKEAAEALGVVPATMRNWGARRIGPPRVKIGRSVHYRLDAINAWILTRETGAAGNGKKKSRGR